MPTLAHLFACASGQEGAAEGEESAPAAADAPAPEGAEAATDAPPAEAAPAPAAEGAEAPAADGEAAPAAEGAPGEGGEGGEGDEADEAAPPPPPEPRFVKRMVTVAKQVSRMHIALGSLPDALAALRTFYFLSSAPGRLGEEDMDAAVECGLLSEGPSLRVLEQLLSSVFMPVLVQMAGGDAPSSGVLMESVASASSSHRDLLANMQKFHSQVSQALQQLTGEVTLELPNVPLDALDA